MNDVGQRCGEGVFVSEEPSGTAHICVKIRAGSKRARRRRLRPLQKVLLASAVVAGDESGRRRRLKGLLGF